MDHGMGNGNMTMSPPSESHPMMMMMQMTFFWGKDVEILFSGWPNKSLGMYILALFFVFFISIGVEASSISPAFKPGTRPAIAGVAQTGLHVIRMGLAYLVMLSVMSFNVGIFLVAIAGHGVGFFLCKRRVVSHQAQSMPK